MKLPALKQRSGSARKMLILAIAAWPALALAAVPAKDGHPDLSGYWDLDAKIPRDAALMRKIAPDTAVLDDTGPVEFPRGEYGGLKLKPAASITARRENSIASPRNCTPSERRLAPRIFLIPTDRARRVARAVARFM